jgi:hypothetical protein
MLKQLLVRNLLRLKITKSLLTNLGKQFSNALAGTLLNFDVDINESPVKQQSQAMANNRFPAPAVTGQKKVLFRHGTPTIQCESQAAISIAAEDKVALNLSTINLGSTQF